MSIVMFSSLISTQKTQDFISLSIQKNYLKGVP